MAEEQKRGARENQKGKVSDQEEETQQQSSDSIAGKALCVAGAVAAGAAALLWGFSQLSAGQSNEEEDRPELMKAPGGSKGRGPGKPFGEDPRANFCGLHGQSNEEKDRPELMKAPGGSKGRGPGKPFGEDPRAYFRGLHVRTDSGSDNTMLKILSYNVWFREDLEVHKRMKAIGDLIQKHSPDLICLQEVTPFIYEIFRHSKWWKVYRCSLSPEMANARPYFCMQLSKLPVKAFKRRPFDNSIMGRELCMAEIDVGMNKKLIVATSHLESPCPAPPKWDQMYSKERVVQAKEALAILKDFPNVIFGGDMNWDDKSDGPFPLNNGWVDAWSELKAGENGWTYDTRSNQMLSGNRMLQKRLDRFVCNLKDFKIESIEMIGRDAIPGISYCKEKKVRNEVRKIELPVLPSDHYGLLLTIRKL